MTRRNVWDNLAMSSGPINRAAASASEANVEPPAAANTGRDHWENPPSVLSPKDYPREPTFTDLTGQRFGLWTVIGLYQSGTGKKCRWLCRCACGDYEIRQTKALKRAEQTGDRCDRCHKLQYAREQERERQLHPISPNMFRPQPDPLPPPPRGMETGEDWLLIWEQVRARNDAVRQLAAGGMSVAGVALRMKLTTDQVKRIIATPLFDGVEVPPLLIKAFVREGITKFEQLAEMYEVELRRLTGLGDKTILVIKTELKRRGLRLKPLDLQVEQLTSDTLFDNTLTLPVPVVRTLEHAGIYTVKTLLRRSRRELKLVSRLGPKALMVILDQLKKKGLALRSEQTVRAAKSTKRAAAAAKQWADPAARARMVEGMRKWREARGRLQ